MEIENSVFVEEFLNEAIRNIDVNFQPSGVIPNDDVTDQVSMNLRNQIKIGLIK